MKTIGHLRRWLSKPGHTKVNLAYYLGHSSTNAIDQWMSRKKIPTKHEERLVLFLGRGQKNVRKSKTKRAK